MSGWLANLKSELLIMFLALLLILPPLLATTLVCLLVAFLFRRPSPALIAICLTLALLFGVGTGYAETLTDADASIQRWPGFDSWWYGLLSAPGGAGDAIVNRLLLHGADWQGGELWAHRHAVAFWNGPFWLATSLVTALPIYFVTDKRAFRLRLT